jgi:hypothetical protein
MSKRGAQMPLLQVGGEFRFHCKETQGNARMDRRFPFDRSIARAEIMPVSVAISFSFPCPAGDGNPGHQGDIDSLCDSQKASQTVSKHHPTF